MIALDIEASGLDYKTDSVVSLGAIDMDNPSRQLYIECRVWDGAHINNEALEINGFTREQLLDKTKPTEADLTHQFIAWAVGVPDTTFAGQNVSFDRDMLAEAAKRAGHTDWPFAHRTIDSHTLCWMHMAKRGLPPPIDPDKRRSALNLDAILLYCGIPEEPKPHNALTGAKSHAEVISRLLYDKKFLPEFDQFAIPWVK